MARTQQKKKYMFLSCILQYGENKKGEIKMRFQCARDRRDTQMGLSVLYSVVMKNAYLC